MNFRIIFFTLFINTNSESLKILLSKKDNYRANILTENDFPNDQSSYIPVLICMRRRKKYIFSELLEKFL